MKDSRNPTLVKLSKEDPDILGSPTKYDKGTDDYFVIDRRPGLNEWYINVHDSEKYRSIQKFTHIRHLKNAEKDYRFKHYMVVVASNNPRFGLPTCDRYIKSLL